MPGCVSSASRQGRYCLLIPILTDKSQSKTVLRLVGGRADVARL